MLMRVDAPSGTAWPAGHSTHSALAAAASSSSQRRVGRVARRPGRPGGRVDTHQHQYQQSRSRYRRERDAPRAPLPHICQRGDARRGHDGEPHEARDYYQFTKTPAARRGRRRRIVNGRRARRALGGPAGVITKVVGAAQRRRQVPAESATSAAPGRPRGEARGARRIGLRALRPRQRQGLPRRARRLAGARGPPLGGRV
mmetsp:Transcript_19424/g.57844  ORF Transcript_19424/g.57844 Transcript_19424/m.57844 type:complete len:200 (-) Transcript_19424:324-923(-)